MKKSTFYFIFLMVVGFANAQSLSTEAVEFQLLQQPKILIEPANRTLLVSVSSPYNIKAEDVITKSKADHQDALKNYDKVVLDSEKEFQLKLKEYDEETVKAKEKFATESVEFKKLSLLERLSMTEQKKNPQLILPTKPVYYKPVPPVYRDPNLDDYIIVDNNVLSSKININGFSKEGKYIEVVLDIQYMNFQDNAGQTYGNQPTKLIVKVNGEEKSNDVFFKEFKLIASSPSNNINKPRAEKTHLEGVITFVNKFLNDKYGFGAIRKTVQVTSVKNKGKYDDLERAHMYVTTNLKKLQPEASDVNDVAFANMKKGTDIWLQTLEKVEYKNSKADFNSKIAKYIYFNLMRINLALENKKEAELYLNQFQENLIYIDLSYDEKQELARLEKEIYAIKK
jgi:hypothetical protein